MSEPTAALEPDEPGRWDPAAATARAALLDRAGVPASLAILLDRVVCARTPSARSAADPGSAIVAVGDLGRALCLLGRVAPREPTRVRLTQHAMLESLGLQCRRLAELWPATPSRFVELTAAAADVVAVDAGRFGDGQRWAVGVELGRAAGRLIEMACLSGPYSRVAAVDRLRRQVRLVREIARRHPPDVMDGALLDRPIVDLGVPRPGSVAIAAAGLAHAIHVDAQAGMLDVRAALAACSAAESAAQLGVFFAERIGTTELTGGTGWRRAPQAWQVLHAALVRFDDGNRGRGDPPGATRRLARQLQDAARFLPDPDGASAEADLATAARATANQLPAVAQQLHSVVSRWADEGRLIARARDLPRSDEHVDAVIRNRFVIATPGDVGPALLAAQVTGRLAVALAAELHRSADQVGVQPQPHLSAALVHQSLKNGPGHDAAYAERLADRCRQVGVAVAG